MDAKQVIFGETGLDRLVQWLRANGHPMELPKLTERYLDILRDLVVVGELPNPQTSQRDSHQG